MVSVRRKRESNIARLGKESDVLGTPKDPSWMT
jgi:hypothetical protein